MAQIDNVYSYLTENYGLNEPIILSELNISDVKPVSLRQQIKKLTEDGRLNVLIRASITFPESLCSVSGLCYRQMM